MTDNEKTVMTDCYKFLNDFGNPPAKDDPGCDEFWEKAADRLREVYRGNKYHPLAEGVGCAVYTYIEEKWKAINRKRGL